MTFFLQEGKTDSEAHRVCGVFSYSFKRSVEFVVVFMVNHTIFRENTDVMDAYCRRRFLL